MLVTAGELRKRMIKLRLQAAITRGGGLSKRQCGFRPRKSILGAIENVTRSVELPHRGYQKNEMKILLAMVNVRNSFNIVQWKDFITALEKYINIPKNLNLMVKSHPKDRVFLY